MAAEQKRKIQWAISLFLAMLYFSGLPAQAQYGGGSGMADDPFLIYTAEQMNAIGANPNDWDKHFKLVADIDLSAYTGTSFNIIGSLYGSFRGVFDGSGHTISNFTYTSTGADNIGLFGRVYGGAAKIKDLGLINPNVDAGTGIYVGSLVGSLSGGAISNCYAEGGSVSGAGSEYRGGVGGLVGENGYSGTITGSYASSTVTGDNYVGGLVGYNDNILAHCYATGNVAGTTNVGGLVGENDYGTITNCYATGSVTGTADVGGLVGAGNQWALGEVTFSFWDIQTSGQSTSASGTGKTTAEMQNPNTFMDAGWDFVGKPDGPSDVWAEPAGGGYPILWWQLSPPPPLPTFSGGTGEPDEPYLVSTAADLNSIGHNPRLIRAHFKLTNDIDLAGIDFYIIGSEAFPFTGVLDGSGHTISNFRYTSTLYRTEDIGLFGYVDGPNAEIRDLGLIAPNISGRNNVGSLVGQLGYGTVSGCYTEGGSVSGRNYVGGLVGDNSGRATITNCYAQGGSVMGTGFVVGGLVGSNLGTITDCYATGSVFGNRNVGGLVGSNYSTITNCYSSGDISGDESVGGLVGTNSYGTIADCYSTSSVVGIEHVGGLVGSGGRAHNSFWDVQTSGQSTSVGGKGRTTAQMQIASTFLGWNGRGNEGVWTIDEGNDYPRLWWENKQGEVIETQQLSNLLTGAGTQDDPYLIYTAEELNVIGLLPFEWDKQFRLISDIDLSQYVGTEFNIIGIPNPFSGVFDGNGKKITNLNHTNGLFVYVSGAIRDLGLIDANVDAGTGYRVGSLVGDLQGGTISNCYAEGGSVLGGSDVGGLVGALNWGATITNCYSSGDVSGDDSVGGLVGALSWGGTITNCYSSGDVSASGEYAFSGVGGLVGENGYSGTITNCYASGSVTGTTNVGGLVSLNYGTITNCYATGSVLGSGTEWWPGVVGGLVGENWGEVTDSFWDTQTSGQVTSDGGTGKTTAEMQTESTFTDAGWDFVAERANGTEDIWWILEGRDYPRLNWELIEDEPNEVADSLSEALDTALSFTTGGSADWFAQTTMTRYDGDAAQSGDISRNQDSWMQTTVSGKGTVKFYWKVSSEEDFDFLEFYIDGSLQENISGLEDDWEQQTYTISTSGSHTLEWRYVKDGSGNEGSDCGWVDKVEW